MAKYELGAVYKIDSQNKDVYYARLLANDCYGVFAPLNGDVDEETFAQTNYRIYLTCNSFAVKRGIWERILPSPDKTDIERWQRPQYLANFGNFNRKLFLDQCKVYFQNGNLGKCESKELFIALVRSGMILFNFNTYEYIPKFLTSYYDGFPNSYIVHKEFIHSGTLEYQKEQLDVLQELGFDIGNLL